MSSEEPNVCNELADLCGSMNIKCLVQVGAENGFEASFIQKKTGCEAVCIDGDTRCKPIEGNVKYFHEVIGATDGPGMFYVNPNHGLSSQIQREEDPGFYVQEQRLDTFCEKNGIAPDALIIDTEGTTMEVLEGATRILDGVRMIYAECQTHVIRPGIRLLGEIDAFLVARGFTRRDGPPSYSCGSQGNYTWVRK